jgi:acyl-CoA thioesterase FadM
MDEALSYGMIANVIEEMGYEGAFSNYGGEAGWREALEQGKAPHEVLKGRMVTAKMEVKFLRPVLCPGIVGVEVDVLEKGEAKMRIRGVMRDGEGRPLMEAEGVWVQIGRARL